MAWQPSYATAAELAAWLGVPNEGVELGLATEAASRAIDKACFRQFGQDTAARFYTPYLHRDRYWIDTDDLVAGDVVIETLDAADNPVDTITEFILTPRNAVADGRPYTRIELDRGATVTDPLKITATWGWANVPPAIRTACLMQAARIHSRRDTPEGLPTSHVVDDVQQGWAAATATQGLDADVLNLIQPFKNTRLSWVVA